MEKDIDLPDFLSNLIVVSSSNYLKYSHAWSLKWLQKHYGVTMDSIKLWHVTYWGGRVPKKVKKYILLCDY